ncbi:MAG TPA: DUF503 domain-containing protein [Acidimicrobiales bacterium]|nr:DUF503 domain-containing protein [Acidimicrobiales bacterium]
MHVGVLRIELHIPQSHSLKERRAAVKPIVEGAKRRFGVAAADVAHQDTWQRADLGVAAIAASAGHVGEVLDEVERFVWSHAEVEVLSSVRSWVDLDA